jgi:hypothetical protein
MRKQKIRTRRSSKGKRWERDPNLAAQEPTSGARETTRPKRDHLGAFYAAGPVLGLDPTRQGRAADPGTNSPRERKSEAIAEATVEPLWPVSGEGEPHHVTAFGDNGSLRLQGRTEADFSNSFRTRNVVTGRATDCTSCSEGQCVHVMGTLAATYGVTTSVTLPRVSDFPTLTPCQQQRVQHAIDSVLAPHERQHVAAFNTYSGMTQRPFDLTLCRNAFDSTIRSMFEAEEGARRQAAQAASDRLDPFHFDVDLHCKDRREAERERQGFTEAEQAANPED